MMPHIKFPKSKFKINSSLFLILFVIVPGILIWFFLGKDINKIEIISIWMLYIIVTLFVILVFVISAIFIKINILEIQSLNFVVPMTIIFGAIILTYELNSILRFTIVIILVIFLTMITMYLTGKSVDSKRKNLTKKPKINNSNN